MKPEREARRVLSTVRATAKMHEFRAAPEDFIAIVRDPKALFTLAVGLLGDVAAAIAEGYLVSGTFTIKDRDEEPETWANEDLSAREGAQFAATFFDAYLLSRLNESLDVEFSLLCAAAYYLADSPGNASVVVRHSEEPDIDLGSGLALLAYKILGGDFEWEESDSYWDREASELLAALQGFYDLSNDGEEVFAICEGIFEDAFDDGTPRELLYADLVVALCARKLRNSSRNLLPGASNLALDAWSAALEKEHFPTELWPAQQRIAEAGLLQGASAVIQMPTSAGKTRATELIIRASFISGRSNLAVIVAPFRSLCHDIRGDLSKAFANDDITLDEVSDSYQFDIDLEGVLAQRTVLIVTPEKLLYMLRRAPELGERIGLIIYDEGHQFDGLTRGPTYELLLSSLRMTLSDTTQVILISAVIGNAAQVAGWLLKNEDAVVAGRDLLPTAKSIAFASWEHQRGWLQYVKPDDPDESEFFVPRIINVLPLAKLRANERDRVFPERDRPQDHSESTEVGLYLGLHLVPNGSVALFCGQKDTVTKLCRRAVEIFARKVDLPQPLKQSDPEQVAKIAALCASQLGAQSTTAEAAALGIFGHHANTPHGIRLAIEHAMKVGHAKFVVCTSTLAQGVNFPIKYLVITATQQGRERIKIRDFHNLMGRAGRAGMHTEGSVIFSAPALYDEREGQGRWRWRDTKNLLDPAQSEPVGSSILDLFKPYDQPGTGLSVELPAAWLDLAFSDRARIEAIIASMLAQFPIVSASDFRPFIMGRARAVQNIAAYLTAHVDFEDPEVVTRVAELAANTLAYHLADEDKRTRLLEVFQAVATAILNNADGDMQALIRRSPLPPADILDLKAWLTDNLVDLKTALEEGRYDETVVARILPLISATSIRSLTDPAVVQPSLDAWMDGESFETIAKILTDANVRFGNRKPTVEHAVALCESGFAYDLAMVVASVADLLEPLDEELGEATAILQTRIKYGLTNASAIAFHEAGFADRVVATTLAAVFPDPVNRKEARQACRADPVTLSAVLNVFPAYFESVAKEILEG